MKTQKEINYDAWLHWHITRVCNLDCQYCFSKSPLRGIEVAPVDIERVKSTLEKSGKIFRISFTGGEPFAVPNIIELCKALSDKHFISFNTNLTSPKLFDLADSIDPGKVLEIHASFHFEELKNKNLIKRFLENYEILKNRGFNIRAEQVAHPALLNKTEEIKLIFTERDWKFNFGSYFGKYNNKKYPERYSTEEIINFELKINELDKFEQKGEICNAGFNAAVVFSNGDVYPCFQVKEKIGNIFNSINFKTDLIVCKSKHCGCPLNKYDDYLFKKAVQSE